MSDDQGTWGRVSKHPGGGVDVATTSALDVEVTRARRKFPGNRLLLAALMEEVGELSKALLQGECQARVQAEAIQVACVAVRIFEEGDATFENLTEEEAKK